MSSKFNIVNKPKKIETEEETEEETELEEEIEKKEKDQNAKKKMMKFMMFFIIGFVVLILIIFLCTLLINKKYTYEEIELVLKDAAIAYFADHKDYLPQNDGDVMMVEAVNLSVEEKMKPLSEYTEEGVACNGYVEVQKVGEEYVYTPYLDCGEAYTTIELYKQITTNENVVTSGYGLYSLNGYYTYRGENVNNYVQLEKALWRIVKITPGNNIVLIKAETDDTFQPWDDRYNKLAGYNSGINTYGSSRIKESLEKLYKSNTEEDSEIQILSNNDRVKTVPHNVCIGKRGENQVSKNGEVECKEIIKNQKISILPVYDFINASVDPDCTTPNSLTCENYNYLSNGKTWWTITADSATTYNAYEISEGGRIRSTSTNTYSNMRPVIHLNSRVMYKEGNGTKEKPYVLK